MTAGVAFKKGRKTMPTDRPNRHKPSEFDWWSFMGLLGALLLLVATGIGYVDGLTDARKQAAVEAYLETGINQPQL